jgi:hypothetical protein
VLVALCAVLAVPAAALEVEEVRWGFDGLAVPERMNLLSVLVSNPKGDPFDRVVTLHRDDGIGRRVGERFGAACYVAPFKSRWLQFYPYVSGEGEPWVLSFAPLDTHKLKAPRLGPPAIIRLADTTSTASGTSGVRSFPAELFPSTVCATDGLYATVLDHAPRWEPARRQALKDWLVRGGVLHLCTGEDGKRPEFGAGLEELNDSRNRFRVGAGLVTRHSGPASLLAAEAIADAGVRRPELRPGGGYGWRFEDVALQSLGQLVRPDHNWGLIFLLLLGYMASVALINYLIARKWRGFAAPAAFFAASVIVFSAATGYVGRRGYGEQAAIHTFSYARSMGGTAWDVTQWTNVFVTRGAEYTLTHPGDHNLYATCSRHEAVPALSLSGLGGMLRADIPLYSSRAFLHRGRMDGPDLGLTVTQWGGGERPDELEVNVAGPVRAAAAWVVHRDQISRMVVEGDTLRLQRRRWSSLDTLADSVPNDFGLYRGGAYGGPVWHGGSKTATRLFEDLSHLFLAHWAGVADDAQHRLARHARQDDRVRVLIRADAPADFALIGKRLGKEKGCVIYEADLFKPESSDE